MWMISSPAKAMLFTYLIATISTSSNVLASRNFSASLSIPDISIPDVTHPNRVEEDSDFNLHEPSSQSHHSTTETSLSTAQWTHPTAKDDAYTDSYHRIWTLPFDIDKSKSTFARTTYRTTHTILRNFTNYQATCPSITQTVFVTPTITRTDVGTISTSTRTHVTTPSMTSVHSRSASSTLSIFTGFGMPLYLELPRVLVAVVAVVPLILLVLV